MKDTSIKSKPKSTGIKVKSPTPEAVSKRNAGHMNEVISDAIGFSKLFEEMDPEGFAESARKVESLSEKRS